MFLQVFNPLTMNYNYSCHRNSAACYQLVQSVLKISSALAERVGQGEVGRCFALGDSAWQLLQLAIAKAWSALDGPFSCFVVPFASCSHIVSSDPHLISNSYFLVCFFLYWEGRIRDIKHSFMVQIMDVSFLLALLTYKISALTISMPIYTLFSNTIWAQK